MASVVFLFFPDIFRQFINLSKLYMSAMGLGQRFLKQLIRVRISALPNIFKLSEIPIVE